MFATTRPQRIGLSSKPTCHSTLKRRNLVARAACTRREAAVALGAVIFSALPLAADATSVTQDPKFIEETNKLSQAIRLYMDLDPYDKARIQALNEVKSEGKAWIAAHAKGGSAPGQAGKRMYVAVDAVQGHANANGAAPLPKQKVKFVTSVLDEVDVLIAQGK